MFSLFKKSILLVERCALCSRAAINLTAFIHSALLSVAYVTVHSVPLVNSSHSSVRHTVNVNSSPRDELTGHLPPVPDPNVT